MSQWNKFSELGRTHPTWNSTFGPMQKKQSTTRNAKIIGMLLMYLPVKCQNYTAGWHFEDTYKLKNQGSEATDSCTSTSWKWSWMTGRHRATKDSNTRWSRRVPCIDVLSAAVRLEGKNLACNYHTYSIRAISDHRLLAITRMPALLTRNCKHVRKHAYRREASPTSE